MKRPLDGRQCSPGEVQRISASYAGRAGGAIGVDCLSDNNNNNNNNDPEDTSSGARKRAKLFPIFGLPSSAAKHDDSAQARAQGAETVNSNGFIDTIHRRANVRPEKSSARCTDRGAIKAPAEYTNHPRSVSPPPQDQENPLQQSASSPVAAGVPDDSLPSTKICDTCHTARDPSLFKSLNSERQTKACIDCRTRKNYRGCKKTSQMDDMGDGDESRRRLAEKDTVVRKSALPAEPRQTESTLPMMFELSGLSTLPSDSANAHHNDEIIVLGQLDEIPGLMDDSQDDDWTPSNERTPRRKAQSSKKRRQKATRRNNGKAPLQVLQDQYDQSDGEVTLIATSVSTKPAGEPSSSDKTLLKDMIPRVDLTIDDSEGQSGTGVNDLELHPSSHSRRQVTALDQTLDVPQTPAPKPMARYAGYPLETDIRDDRPIASSSGLLSPRTAPNSALPAKEKVRSYEPSSPLHIPQSPQTLTTNASAPINGPVANQAPKDPLDLSSLLSHLTGVIQVLGRFQKFEILPWDVRRCIYRELGKHTFANPEGLCGRLTRLTEGVERLEEFGWLQDKLHDRDMAL